MSNENAFVIMPFSESLSEVYNFLIKGTLEEAGYSVKRADDIKSQNNILEDIIKGIASSDLIIPDLTDSNPNVYYELGIAHAMGKNVVLIIQDLEDLPFDLRSYRVISYSTHFSKMLKAKEELSELAKEAIKGQIPFGNPVKDFAPININSNVRNTTLEYPENIEDYGILDYQIEIENSFSELTKIITNVGAKLSNELTPEIVRVTSEITSNNNSTKQKRTQIQALACHLEEFGKFLVPNNENYRTLLKKVETSLEFLLSGEVAYQDQGAKDGILGFLNALEEMEKGAFVGRQGFIGMLETQKQLPKIEKSFNRSNMFMQAQVEQFIENIDLTISISSRARILGKSLLNK